MLLLLNCSLEVKHPVLQVFMKKLCIFIIKDVTVYNYFKFLLIPCKVVVNEYFILKIMLNNFPLQLFFSVKFLKIKTINNLHIEEGLMLSGIDKIRIYFPFIHQYTSNCSIHFLVYKIIPTSVKFNGIHTVVLLLYHFNLFPIQK